MSQFICIHGHFYQPPRENAWLDTIELQPSALPDHDWNERITTECYRPNAAARILDEQGRILDFINIYEHISFNFGPTLLSWMQGHAPDVYDAIVNADERSRHRYSGHGSAIAQAYNHLIMPLASPRDRRTQVIWGIRDFEHRFHRRPEGMWLPETAVNLDTLEALAEQGIAFTILAPHQIASVADEQVHEDAPAPIDTRRPYRIDLPSGHSIAVFAYDGDLAQAVAFERLLDSGDAFAGRLIGALPSGDCDPPPLVHLATDGETYGHHHRFGEMALAFALRAIDWREDIHLTNYGEYLERFPPTQRARLIENTSWSCAHGIERWKSDCGCCSGAHPQWNQLWREPLRAALDALRDDASTLFYSHGSQLFIDPWRARDDYIEVVLDRSDHSIEHFLHTSLRPGLTDWQHNEAIMLMEMQRHAMLMFTSCGWFFDELSGIETRQILQYATRVVELGRDVGNAQFGQSFMDRMGLARSNIREMGTGHDICTRINKTGARSLAGIVARRALMDIMQVDASDHESYDGHDINILRRIPHPHAEGTIHHAMATVSSQATRRTQSIEYVGFAFGGEIGCIHQVYDDSDVASTGLLAPFVHDLRERGTHAILKPLPPYKHLLMRLPDLPIEIQCWYLKERWAQLIAKIHHQQRIETEEYSRLHALALSLGVHTPPALLHLLHAHVNLDVRDALRTDPPDFPRLAEQLVRAHSLLVPLDHQLLHPDVSQFVIAVIERLQDVSTTVREIQTMALIARDLAPLLLLTELRALGDACLSRLSRITTCGETRIPELDALHLVLEALGLHSPTDVPV